MKRRFSVSMMVYPADFKEQLLRMEERCDDPFSFFDQDFVFCVVHINADWDEQEDLWAGFVSHMNYQTPSIALFDTDEIAATFKRMAEYRKQGLSVAEYGTWIVRMSVWMKALAGGTNIVCQRVKIGSEESKNTGVMFLTSSNPTLLDEPYVNGIVSLARRRMRECIPQKAISKPRAERDVLTKSIRFEVFKRDCFRCRHCGATKNDTALHVDHILPVARGGTDTMENLQTLCKACNLSKSSRVLE